MKKILILTFSIVSSNLYIASTFAKTPSAIALEAAALADAQKNGVLPPSTAATRPAQVVSKAAVEDLGAIRLETNRNTGSDDVDLQLGDDYDAVLRAYNKPLGKANRGGLEILIYSRGQVEMKDGKVVAIKMVSRKAYQEKQVRRAARIEMEKQLIEREKNERLKKAEDKLARVLADPDFDEKKPIDQVNFWRKFKRDYPELNVEPFFKEALTRLKDEK